MEIKKDGGGLHAAPVERGHFKALHPERGKVPVNIIRLATDDMEEARKAVVSDPNQPGSFRVEGLAAIAYAGVRSLRDSDDSSFPVEVFEEVSPATPNSVEPSPSV